jgi:hypothetical protein
LDADIVALSFVKNRVPASETFHSVYSIDNMGKSGLYSGSASAQVVVKGAR